MIRTARQRPVGMQPTSTHIPIRVTDTQIEAFGIATGHVFFPPGWSLMSRADARTVAMLCDRHGKADRRDPMPAGYRISLQRLAVQIRAKL